MEYRFTVYFFGLIKIGEWTITAGDVGQAEKNCGLNSLAHSGSLQHMKQSIECAPPSIDS